MRVRVGLPQRRVERVHWGRTCIAKVKREMG